MHILKLAAYAALAIALIVAGWILKGQFGVEVNTITSDELAKAKADKLALQAQVNALTQRAATAEHKLMNAMEPIPPAKTL